MNNELEDTYINEHLIRNSTQSNRYYIQKVTLMLVMDVGNQIRWL